MNISTLKPGILVSLKTSVTGNVEQSRVVLEAPHITTGGALRTKAEVTRTIIDPAEHEAAARLRARAGALIRGICIKTDFGLICPAKLETELDRVIDEAQELAARFNIGSNLSKVGVYVLRGRIAADDMQAVRAMNSEVRGLIDAINAAIEAMDAKAVRKAAKQVKAIANMMEPGAAEKIKDTVELARAAARKMVKAGEGAAIEIDNATIKKIKSARTAFLDIEPAVTAEPVKAKRGRGRQVEIETAAPELSPALKALASRKRRAALLESAE